MEVIMAIEKELMELHQRGEMKWLCSEEGEARLLANDFDLFLEVISWHNKFSKLFSFEVVDKTFHYLIHYGQNGEEDRAQFFWDLEVSLIDLK